MSNRTALLASLAIGGAALLAAVSPSPAAPPASESKPVAAPAKPFGHFERKDPRFDKLVPPDAQVERLANGFTWVEGPVWVKDGGYLVFSEIPNNRIWRWKEGEGLKVFMDPAGFTGKMPREGEPGTNGLTVDNDGRLTLCEHGDRRVTRVEKDGKKTVLADKWEGKRLNSPNDLVYDSKGNLFFTDPPYGLVGNMDDPTKELPFQGVFRVAADGKMSLVVKDIPRPNGIALSPDEKTLYVASSDSEKPVIMAYELKADGTAANGRVFFDAATLAKDKARKGAPDGMKVDKDGNLWATGPGGVFVFAPDGTHLGTITSDDLPIANCAWGDDGSVLYMASNKSIIRLKTGATGKVPGAK